jgi:peptidoglycan/LPS O-acetylase OafA/YrhL
MQLDTGHRRNNFDFLRIVAALMVLFGHSYVLSGRGAFEPLARYSGLDGFGGLGVSIFFVISGFLVTASYDRCPDPRAYFAGRLLRILPGLAVALLLSALVLGPLVTDLPRAVYFSDLKTWLYVTRNLLLYPVTYDLPGVFTTNPYPDAVNGSLWTLRLEFTCYLLIPLLDWRRVLRPRVVEALALLAGVACLALVALGPERIPNMALLGARFGFLFVAGAALYYRRDQAWLRSGWTLAASAALFGLAAPFEPVAMLVTPPVLAVLVIAFALRPLPGLSSFSRYGDFSYGIYIYAFPVQQAWIHLIGPERLEPLAFTGLALACVLPLAAASWLLVEKPALDLKKRIRAYLTY